MINRSLCKCGCGEKVKWNKRQNGWRDYVNAGHSIRSKNYPGFLKEAPLCKCGCSGKVGWDKWNKSWRKFVFGHGSRGVRYWQEYY